MRVLINIVLPVVFFFRAIRRYAVYVCTFNSFRDIEFVSLSIFVFYTLHHYGLFAFPLLSPIRIALFITYFDRIVLTSFCPEHNKAPIYLSLPRELHVSRSPQPDRYKSESSPAVPDNETVSRFVALRAEEEGEGEARRERELRLGTGVTLQHSAT